MLHFFVFLIIRIILTIHWHLKVSVWLSSTRRSRIATQLPPRFSAIGLHVLKAYELRRSNTRETGMVIASFELLERVVPWRAVGELRRRFE